jgi:manganese efflux pump family protein
VVELLLVAAAVGLGNFAAAIGIGISGVDGRIRLRVGLVFGGFETAMPILGLLLGRRIAGPLGSKASLLGGALLIATGLFGLVQARRARGEEDATLEMPMRRLLLIGAALSVDNLVVGLALGTSGTSLVEAVLTIGVVSIAMTLVGLELGCRLGSRFEEWAGELGAAVLVAVGVVVAAGVL